MKTPIEIIPPKETIYIIHEIPSPKKEEEIRLPKEETPKESQIIPEHTPIHTPV